MAGDDVPAPAVQYRFDLQVDGVDVGLFTKIDGLGAEYETLEVKEGGENGFTHVLRGRMKLGRITLTRPVDANSGDLAAWLTAANESLHPQRCTATIAAFDGAGGEVARWDLIGVYPVKYAGPSFAAGSSGTLTESVELAHNGFTTRRGSTGSAAPPPAAAAAPGPSSAPAVAGTPSASGPPVSF